MRAVLDALSNSAQLGDIERSRRAVRTFIELAEELDDILQVVFDEFFLSAAWTWLMRMRRCAPGDNAYPKDEDDDSTIPSAAPSARFEGLLEAVPTLSGGQAFK